MSTSLVVRASLLAASFVGMSAETTMTATTIQIAVDANIKPADSGQPVSP